MDGDDTAGSSARDLATEVAALAEKLHLPALPADILASVVEAYDAILQHSERLSAWQEKTR